MPGYCCICFNMMYNHYFLKIRNMNIKFSQYYKNALHLPLVLITYESSDQNYLENKNGKLYATNSYMLSCH